jgi:hypothetical protein
LTLFINYIFIEYGWGNRYFLGGALDLNELNRDFEFDLLI